MELPLRAVSRRAVMSAGVAGLLTLAAGPRAQAAGRNRHTSSWTLGAERSLAAHAHLAQRREEFAATMTALAGGGAVRLAVAAADRITGVHLVHEGLAPGEPGLVLASGVKLDIALVLGRVASMEGRGLTMEEQALLSTMIRDSDNDAASALWDRVGGAAGMAEAYAAWGVSGVVPHEEGQWGLTTSTAAGRLQVLGVLCDGGEGVSAAHRGLVSRFMGEVCAGEDWGVGSLGQGGQVIVKNGWLPREADEGRWVITTTGRITAAGSDVVVSVLTRGNVDEERGIELVERAAAAARDLLAT